MDDKEISIILPSYKPDEKLLSTVLGLETAGFKDIIVVDDGGGKEYKSYFEELRRRESCTVLTHEENRGKGAAIKTAISWYLLNRHGAGVITVDGDGQHRPEDVAALAAEMKTTGNMVLGVRDFSQPDVPARSRAGNRITSFVFRVFVRIKISDTQTGLRAIPTNLLPMMLEIAGDRYEYETNVLLGMRSERIPFSEVKIQTVYIDDNDSSHFHVFRDSAKIYWLIIKYIFSTSFVKFMFSSILCYGIDWLLFTGLHYWLVSVYGDTRMISTLIPTVSARIVSSMLNFFINRNIFNKGGGKLIWTMVKYYLLAACILGVSTVSLFYAGLGLSKITWVQTHISEKWLQPIIKLPIDFVLYLISYNIQRKFVFKKVGTD